MKNSPERTSRRQLLDLQRATYRSLLQDATKVLPRETREMRAYGRLYEREVRAFARIANKAALIEKVAESSIVYCGDYHTLSQAQRTVIRILREVAPSGRSISLGLEMIAPSDEETTRRYLEGRIKEREFLRGIDYKRRWGFPWPHYRQLFDFARTNGIRMIGLNSFWGDKIPLSARDDLAADRIVESTQRSPEGLIFCLYGDLHIAESHIPSRVEVRLKRLGLKRRTLTVFQNSEAIYWRLAAEGRAETIDVVQIAPRKYCVLSAAPWVKVQSYRSWLEDHGDLLDESEEGPDFFHQVLSLARRISSFLKLRPSDLPQFSVVTASNPQIIRELENHCKACRRKDLPIEALVQAEILENRSCYFPESSVLYLSDLSENRAAEKASQLVAGKLDPVGWVFGVGTDRKEVFYRLVLWEAIGFFGSKLINPKRKCDRFRDFERYLREIPKKRLSTIERERRSIAIHVLLHRTLETRSFRTIVRLEPKRFFLVASALGKILANRLYYGLARNRITLDTARGLMSPLDRDNVRAATQRYREYARITATLRADQTSKGDSF